MLPLPRIEVCCQGCIWQSAYHNMLSLCAAAVLTLSICLAACLSAADSGSDRAMAAWPHQPRSTAHHTLGQAWSEIGSYSIAEQTEQLQAEMSYSEAGLDADTRMLSRTCGHLTNRTLAGTCQLEYCTVAGGGLGWT